MVVFASINIGNSYDNKYVKMKVGWSAMDFTEVFKSRGHKSKYMYVLSVINNKKHKYWYMEKEESSTKKLEDEKRLMMKEHSLLLIAVDMEDL